MACSKRVPPIRRLRLIGSTGSGPSTSCSTVILPTTRRCVRPKPARRRSSDGAAPRSKSYDCRTARRVKRSVSTTISPRIRTATFTSSSMRRKIPMTSPPFKRGNPPKIATACITRVGFSTTHGMPRAFYECGFIAARSTFTTARSTSSGRTTTFGPPSCNTSIDTSTD